MTIDEQHNMAFIFRLQFYPIIFIHQPLMDVYWDSPSTSE
jgi:hypothetical protein